MQRTGLFSELKLQKVTLSAVDCCRMFMRIALHGCANEIGALNFRAHSQLESDTETRKYVIFLNSSSTAEKFNRK